jgi:hypothetical protein
VLEPNRTRQSVQTEDGRLQPLRRRLAAWVAAGVAPPGLAPCTIAAAFVRATGRQPARDQQFRSIRAYSRDELQAALNELAGAPPPPAPPPPPPPGDPLALMALIWHGALRRVPLPSTRMLLWQQCRLIGLGEQGRELVARVAVVAQWLPMVKSRQEMVSQALADTLARPVALVLLEVEQ